MPEPGARRTRVLGLALGFLLLAAAIFVAGPRAASEVDRDPRMSSYLATDQGARGLHLALEQLGAPVERYRLSPGELPPGGTLVLLRPVVAPDSAARAELVRWVRAGGTLVLSPNPGAPALPQAFDPDLRVRSLEEPVAAYPAPGDTADTGDTGDTGDPADTGVADPPPPDPPHPWVAGLDSVPGVARVWAQVPEEARVLLATAQGEPLLLRLPLGEGVVVAWSDPALLGNEALQDDAAPAFPLVRAALEHPPVRFDEYHQGFRGEGSPARALRDVLLTTGGGRWALQAAGAALLLLLLAGHRFGRPRPLLEERGRSPLEHADALAAVYRKASAHRTAARRLLTGLQRSLGQRPTPELDLPRGLRDTPAARRLAREWARGDDADLEALSRAMDDLLSEARG